MDRIFTEGFVWLQNRADDLSLITKVVDVRLLGRESNDCRFDHKEVPNSLPETMEKQTR